MQELIRKLIDVPSIDPEDARRRKLLNILLLGIGVLTLTTLLLSLTAMIFNMAGESSEVEMLLVACLVLLIGAGVLYALNRYRGGGWWAAVLFLLLLEGAFSLTDTPRELANGRSLFIYAIPVIIASVILKPYASFLFATVTGVIISGLAVSLDIVPNAPAIIGFYVIALVSWLSSRSLERALDDLQAVNRELDQRVIDRTRDLAEALTRVQAESGKNQAILESIADGVIVFDNQRRAIVTNPSLSHLIDWPTEEIIGKELGALLGERMNAKDLSRVLAIKETQRAEMKFELGKRTLSVSFAPVRDSEGTPLGTVMVFRDFTREAELERMKSALVSTASHELRTPLNAILGYSDMLKEEVYGPVLAEQTSILDRVIANTKRMLSLVNNLLDQAQIEAGQLRITPAPLSVRNLVIELQSIMSVLAEQKKIAFDCSVSDDLPDRLLSDSGRLQQILVNLVGNAIKFTDHGGVRVRLEKYGTTQWRLQVADTGVGMPPDALEYIFEPFRQVDDTVTRRYAGTGLGLSIVKQLANLLGGDIIVTSAVGQGSTFTVTLPLTPVQEEVIS
ncbi:MAG TPA: PAS domain-containing sensor histidine kinase [Aggregatilineaceae bacterium]|nr:PAS domain-containing sensor histidine kinase [Aggregatilineaceae bacterium]